MKTDVDTGGVIVPIRDGEAMLRRGKREISILVAREEVTITHGRCSAGEQIAGPHVHHEHTDAFYALEGGLTFAIGREAEIITVSSGGFVAVPPQVAHSLRNDGDCSARWLTIHARDGGFAAFMRGARDGVEVEWDMSAVPADGGLPASEAFVSPDLGGERLEYGNRLCRLRCARPDMCVVEWHLRGPHSDLPFHDQGRDVDSFFVIEGELEAMLAGTRQILGPGTLISFPRGMHYMLNRRGPGCARILSLHTPDGGLADHLRRVSVERSRYAVERATARTAASPNSEFDGRRTRHHSASGAGSQYPRFLKDGVMRISSAPTQSKSTSRVPRSNVRRSLTPASRASSSARSSAS